MQHIQKCSKLFLKFSNTRFRWSSIYIFFNVCKKSKSTTGRFSVLSKAYNPARVCSRDSNCTAHIYEITRTLLSCTDGCAEHRQHGFRWTKHGAFSEKALNKSVQSRTQRATTATAKRVYIVSMTKACLANWAPATTAVYWGNRPTKLSPRFIYPVGSTITSLSRITLFPPPLHRLQIRFINSILNISSPHSFPSSRARLTGNHPEHLGRGSSRWTLQPLGGRCERGSPLCCEDFSTHQALQGLICGRRGVQEGEQIAVEVLSFSIRHSNVSQKREIETTVTSLKCPHGIILTSYTTGGLGQICGLSAITNTKQCVLSNLGYFYTRGPLFVSCCSFNTHVLVGTCFFFFVVSFCVKSVKWIKTS